MQPGAPSEGPKTVYLSYSHASPEASGEVANIAAELRRQGFSVLLDREVFNDDAQMQRGAEVADKIAAMGYTVTPPSSPDTAHPALYTTWMEDGMNSADFVLVVCTDNDDAGKGLTHEHNTISHKLFDAGGSNNRFIPVVVGTSSQDVIPTVLRPYTSYSWGSPEVNQDLINRLRGVRRFTRPPLGSVPVLAPEPPTWDPTNS